MYVPWLTPKSKLSKRRGGGKSGGGGGGGDSSSGSSGTAGKGGTGSDSTGGGGVVKSTEPISTSGTSRTAMSYGNGGGKVVTIPSGQVFSGRTEGGGTRAQVFGSRTFGSGYPGFTTRGVQNRPFPFFFWPLSFGVGTGVGTGAYLHSNTEYGHADNTSRPGGVMITAAFQTNTSSTSSSSTFRILADNATVSALIADITANCSLLLSPSTDPPTPSPYNDTAADASPQPEQVVQYYRASSIALSLDGYNNSAIFADEGTPDVPLPSTVDAPLLDCLNQTIGAAAPLIDGAVRVSNNFSLLGLVWLVWFSCNILL